MTHAESAYITLTPYGRVDAVFGDGPGVSMRGPDDAIAHVLRVMQGVTGHGGMTLTVDSVEELDYFSFCQPEGSNIRILPPAGVALDSSDDDAGESEEGDEDDDTDPEAEFEAAPDEEDDAKLDGMVLDGDFHGHPFRGNQYRKASRESGAAVSASIKAKRAETRGGDAKAQKSAHRGAHHAHMAAAEGATGKAKNYHRKMAKFHGQRAGVRLDSVALDRASAGPDAEPVMVNKFESGDKVISLDDNNDYTVTGQRGEKVSVKGSPKAIHANRLKLASGKKPERMKLDAVDHDWHRRTQEKFRDYSDEQLRFVIKDATEAEKLGREINPHNPRLGQYADEVSYASMELARRKKGGKKGDKLDAADAPEAADEPIAEVNSRTETEADALDAVGDPQEVAKLRASVAGAGGSLAKLAIARQILTDRQTYAATVPAVSADILRTAEILKAWDGSAAMWSDPQVSREVAAAVAAGWVARPSTSQLQWLQAGVDAFKAAQAAAAPKIDRKAAEEIYSSLSYQLDSMSGSTDTERMRPEVEERLAAKIDALRALVDGGQWPARSPMDPQRLLERADSVLQGLRVLKAAGGPEWVGRGDAASYYVTASMGLTREQIEGILNKPDDVTRSGSIDVPRYKVANLKAAVAAALAPAAPEPFGHNGRRIYPTKVGGEARWAVQTDENKGADRRMGDTLHPSREEAIKEADRLDANAASRARREAEAAEASAAEAAKRASMEDIDGFGDNMGALTRGGVVSALNSQQSFNGQQMTRKAFIRQAVADGATVAPHPADVRRITFAGGGYMTQKDIGKTAMDYAEFLIGKKGGAAPAPKPAGPRGESQLADGELATITDAAKYLKDVVFSLKALGLTDKAVISMSSELGKSGRDTMLMQAFNITRELAHDIHNRLDARVSKSLRDVDMQDAFTMFPALRALVDAAAAKYPAATPQPDPTPPANPQRAADLAVLQQIADGAHPDMLAPELADQIEAALLRHEGDAEIEALADKAVLAYSNGLMAATA